MKHRQTCNNPYNRNAGSQADHVNPDDPVKHPMQKSPDTLAQIRLHHFLPTSRANGPGLRAVAWFQGCTLGCPGCFNHQTHSRRGGYWISVDQLFSQISALQNQVQGVTISGGEPLQQMRPLLKLLSRLRDETVLSILLFSGYTWTEIERMPMGKHVLDLLDVLVAGRYLQDQPRGRGLLGSKNQQIYFLSQRYSAKDVQATPPAEVILTPGGEILLSGIQPLQL